MKKNKERIYISSIVIVIIAIFSKIVQYTLLPDKYFIDSNKILNMMYTNTFNLEGSYQVTAFLSNKINFFRFTTLIQWSIFYAVIFNVFFLYILNKYKLKSFLKYIWFLASVGVVNIYVFNLSKEIFQFIVFLILFFILKQKTSKREMILLSVSILAIWGLIFRIYYLIIAAYILLVYISLLLFQKSSKSKIGVLLSILISGVFISLFIAQFIFPDEYTEILNVHKRLTLGRIGSENAQTLIVDIINHGNNLFLFMVNYVINVIRMMIPVELLLGFKIHYILFFAYQMILTYFFINLTGKVLQNATSNAVTTAYCIYCAYVLGSALFEPDFGSWIRHESATFPIMSIMYINNEQKDLKYVINLVVNCRKRKLNL